MRHPRCRHCFGPGPLDPALLVCATCLPGLTLHWAVCKATNAVEHERAMNHSPSWIKWRWLETAQWEWVLSWGFVDWCLGPYEAHPGRTAPQWGAEATDEPGAAWPES